jgi:hypothetical protein
MAAWWADLLFPLVGLGGLCFLLQRPAQSETAVLTAAPAVNRERAQNQAN